MENSKPKLRWTSKLNRQKDPEQKFRLQGISPSERLGNMYETGLYSDCSFLVEGQEIRAHKLILAAASTKMEEIFFTDNDDDGYLVPVSYNLRVMQLILQHVYLQDMNIQSIEEAQDVIEAAHYFHMKDLVELCCAGIEPETLDEFWPALNLACQYDCRLLKEACLSVALKNKASFFGHEQELFQLSPEALSFLLSREAIQIETELDVITVATAWARNRNDTVQTLRSELQETGVLKHLRFLALNQDEFNYFQTSELAKVIFTSDELKQLECDYYSDACALDVSPLRTERMLETRVPICGTDYLTVDENRDYLQVNVRIFESTIGIRSIIKMLVIPSQINPANILYDNVSHRTHYNESIQIEIYVHDKVIARGSFYDRIKYGDDVTVVLNTFNYVPIYTAAAMLEKEDQLVVGDDDDEKERIIVNEKRSKYYDASIKIMFKRYGYYPLAVETKCLDESVPVPIRLLEEESSGRFIHEFILISPYI